MNGSQVYGVIKRPLITEKANDLKESCNQYSFEVTMGATKLQIRDAAERLFGVKVSQVRTSIVRGKWRRVGRALGRRSNWKKAIITVSEGHEIDLFGES